MFMNWISTFIHIHFQWVSDFSHKYSDYSLNFAVRSSLTFSNDAEENKNGFIQMRAKKHLLVS